MLEQKPFFGTWDEENKAFWVNTMQEHQDADRLISGSWFKEEENGEFKGCFFGCAMQTGESPLEKAISAMGLPDWLIYLAEKIYEGLPDSERLDFPVKLLKSIPAGANLEPVKHKLAIARLTKLAGENTSVSECINTVIELHKLELIGKKPSNGDWSARSAAAAESAAAAAAAAAARSAAWSAWSAWSARSAAESAARSAEAAAAESAAAWSAESAELIKLLSEGMNNAD